MWNKRSIWIGISCFVLLLLSWLSLWLAYDPYASTPWSVQYGWRYAYVSEFESVECKNELESCVKNWSPPWFSGAGIEAIRAFLIATTAFFILGYYFQREFNQVLAAAINRQNRPNLAPRVMGFLALSLGVIGAIFIISHHLSVGPRFLASETQENYWSKAEMPWATNGWREGEDHYRPLNEVNETIRDDWYYKPYRPYLIQSLVNLCLYPSIIFPVLLLGLINDGVFKYNNQVLSPGSSKTTSDITQLQSVADRYLFALFAFSSLTLFEFHIGKLTLAVPAIIWSFIVAGILAALASIVLLLYLRYVSSANTLEERAFSVFLKRVVLPSPWGYLIGLLLTTLGIEHFID